MGKSIEMAQVLAQRELAPGIFDMTLAAKSIAACAKAGQFAAVYCDSPSRLLPRPISLCGIDRAKGTIRLVYRVTGANTGTEEFSTRTAGDRIRIMGPLGNGFTVLPGKRALLVGGGIGVPPMLQLAKDISSGFARGLSGENGGEATGADSGIEMQIVMGYRDADTFLLDEFREHAQCFAATEDGSVGTRGNVLDAIRENRLSADVIYACGPTPMLVALKSYAIERGIECFVSLEERMACGIGACLACVCGTKSRGEHTNVNNGRICKEGPVFDAREVEL